MSKIVGEYELRFSAPERDGYKEPPQFCLMELPADIVELVKKGDNNLTIRGQPDDDAVFCTKDKTYALRSVTLSNNFLIVSTNSGTPTDSQTEKIDEIVISGEAAEILELVPTVPRLENILGHLKGCEYYDEESDEETYESNVNDPLRRRRVTFEDLRSIVQASDTELESGLRKSKILNLNGTLRPLPPTRLLDILVLTLVTIASQGLPEPPKPIPLRQLCTHMEDDFQTSPAVMEQLASWYGSISKDNMWIMDVKAVVAEVGVGLLRDEQTPKEEQEFLERWREQVGDMFAAHVDIALLEGNCLSTPILASRAAIDGVSTNTLSYYPRSALPSDPAQRFQSLFLTRPKWKTEEIQTYLEDIAVDKKERERLMLKYTRQITEPDGMWATARLRY
ncbi:sister chromatid cohesion protein [Ceratobasidium sp. AG-Ba]|nr:sister chromatid cohesion protein [Ceratobasidium sp. AG-Ba]QRW08076.1 sister chromatid cohesion protein [Ceratobasidium sp. AG-Ba]